MRVLWHESGSTSLAIFGRGKATSCNDLGDGPFHIVSINPTGLSNKVEDIKALSLHGNYNYVFSESRHTAKTVRFYDSLSRTKQWVWSPNVPEFNGSEFFGEAKGVAAYSPKLPIRHSLEPWEGQAYLSSRLLDYYVAVTPNVIFQVVVVYLAPSNQNHPNAFQDNHYLLKAAASRLRNASHGPQILIGDFNMTSPDKQQVIKQLLSSGWIHAATKFGKQHVPTTSQPLLTHSSTRMRQFCFNHIRWTQRQAGPHTIPSLCPLTLVRTLSE